jgi:hypothetical protein
MARRVSPFQFVLRIIVAGGLLTSPACVTLAAIPVAAVVGGAELAVKGGDIYKSMRKADERQAFEVPFVRMWEITLAALEDLGMQAVKAAKNKDGDGGLIETRAHEHKISIAVVKMTDRVSEIGVWAKKDKSLADLIIKKIAERAT